MEKRDFVVIFAAIIIVLIMAVVVKPIITGQPVVFLPESPAPIEEVISESNTGTILSTPVDTEIIITPEPTLVQETQEPTIPSQSTVSVTPSITPMTWQPDSDNPMPAIQMTNYAEIVGKYTGSTVPFRIPTPYWELHYHVTPMGTDGTFSMDVKEKSDAGEKTVRTITWRDGNAPDPREYRFFEGGKDYYLIINANQLKEYRINIQIPLKYIRDT
ncbi:MAG: hypothetical protein GXY48_05945 [Methanomicrobiales archaeon]|nr:hypothetical protein [Methanomicrobiales archaeon]